MYISKQLQLAAFQAFNIVVGVKPDPEAHYAINNLIKSPIEVTKYSFSSGILFKSDEDCGIFAADIADTIEVVKNTIATDADINNGMFYSNWNDRLAAKETHIVNQLTHYATTAIRYGDMSKGVTKLSDTTIQFIYEDNDIRIVEPNDIATRNDSSATILTATVIEIVSLATLKDMLKNALTANIALPEDKLKLLYTLVTLTMNVDDIDIESIANKELQAKILVKYPSLFNTLDVETFLRAMIQITTGKSLLIKSEDVISAIASDARTVDVIVASYINTNLTNVAKSFYRYKAYWLAFKIKEAAYTPSVNTAINKARRAATKSHQPHVAPYGMVISQQDVINIPEFKRYAKTLSLSNLVKTYNMLAFRRKARLSKLDINIVTVRNGKTKYITDYTYKKVKGTTKALRYLTKLIAKEVEANLIANSVKAVYTKFNNTTIDLAIPTTLKNTLGVIPNGTMFVTKIDDSNKTIVSGIHWLDVKTDKSISRVDLDYAGYVNGEKLGWDGSASSNGIYFSGDVTDAPHPTGASEALMYPVSVLKDNELTHSVALYTTDVGEVPYTFYYTLDDDKFDKTYNVDLDKVLFKYTTVINQSAITGGTILTNGSLVHTAYSTSIGDVTISASKASEMLKFAKAKYSNVIRLSVLAEHFKTVKVINNQTAEDISTSEVLVLDPSNIKLDTITKFINS